MVRVLNSGFSHLSSSLGTPCRVLGQHTLLSQCLSSPRFIHEHWQIMSRGSHPGGVEILQAASCYIESTKYKHWPNESLGLYANFTLLFRICKNIIQERQATVNMLLWVKRNKLTMIKNKSYIALCNFITQFSKHCILEQSSVYVSSTVCLMGFHQHLSYPSTFSDILEKLDWKREICGKRMVLTFKKITINKILIQDRNCNLSNHRITVSILN